jgi:hypothetical protein
MSRRALKDSPLFPRWVDAVHTRLHRGGISMERRLSARYEWRNLGLTLRQRNAAIKELIRTGVAKTEVGHRGEVLIVRAVPFDPYE